MIHKLKNWTQARIGLGRKGSCLPTVEHLAMLEAQALARDSLWRSWDREPLERFLTAQNQAFLTVETQAKDRQQYLMRPDLGRALTPASEAKLKAWASASQLDTDLLICCTDGLATDAMQKHMQAFLQRLLPRLQKDFPGKSFPLVLVPLARVATADAIAEALRSRLSLMFVGERPGLSAHDSMGIYLTYEPRKGFLDSRRNCISNIRPPDGLGYDLALEQLMYLVHESLRLRLSGVDLKLDVKIQAVGAGPKVQLP